MTPRRSYLPCTVVRKPCGAAKFYLYSESTTWDRAIACRMLGLVHIITLPTVRFDEYFKSSVYVPC